MTVLWSKIKRKIILSEPEKTKPDLKRNNKEKQMKTGRKRKCQKETEGVNM